MARVMLRCSGQSVAFRAQTANLDRLPVGFETEPFRVRLERLGDSWRIDLCDGAATAANQELSHMRFGRAATTDIGVERLDTMDQACLYQEIECAVDRRRRCGTTLAAKPVENVVRFDRRMPRPYECQHSTAQGSKAQPLSLTARVCIGKRGVDTLTVIVCALFERDQDALFHRERSA